MKLKPLFALGALLAALPVMAQAPAAGRGTTPPPAQAHPPTTAPAQTPGSVATPPAPVDPAKAAAIRQLLEVTGSGKLGEELIDLMTTRVRQAVATVIPQTDRLQAFMDAFSKSYASRVTPQQINDAVIPVYAQHLSLEDVQALVAFYQTPAGQHVIKALPLIIQESQSTGANMAQPAAIDTLRSMAAQYPELNQILARQGGAQPQQGAPGAGSNATPAQPQGSQPTLRQIPSQQ